MSNQIEPKQHEHAMPVEIASAMLTAPKAKLTNRMRKNCKEALHKVYPSTSPIVRDESQRMAHTGTEPKLLEKKLRERFSGMSLLQLQAQLRKTRRARNAVQRDYVALQAAECPAKLKGTPGEKKWELQRDNQKAVLDLFAARLDVTRDVAEGIIEARTCGASGA